MTFAIFNDDKSLTDMKRFEHYSLAGYFALVIISQISLNVMAMYFKCGGDFVDSLTNATSLTILPWSLIFGVVIITIMMFPGFKSAFSDVIGYFYISSKSNEVLNTLLVDKNIRMDNLQPSDKDKMRDAADLVMKIYGNTSILINQMVPSNFVQLWDQMRILRKPEYQDDNNSTTAGLKEKLFGLVVTRENVGEAMWYIYTGFLIISLVKMNIETRGCSSNIDVMESKYKQFLSTENDKIKEKELSSKVVYKE
uniref:Uncharacterized protein n=1 Tax=viral metagenome TaxID=1070528 RepID=A0A6C0E5F7_9ZZZZ